ncbi:MAG: ATP-binding protein [Planctomycetaceae bacterium]|nr:ATP-binding protein [Planctomycetaceae bacterium]
MSHSSPHEVVIPSDTLAARGIQMRIVEMLEALEYPMTDVMGVRLALEEVLMNAIKHGNKMDPAKVVRIQYVVTEEHVSVEVEDQGEGFQPDKVPDPTLPENLERPGGRGVFLIQQFMSTVEFNSRGNLVRMKKVRTQVNATPQPKHNRLTRRSQ